MAYTPMWGLLESERGQEDGPLLVMAPVTTLRDILIRLARATEPTTTSTAMITLMTDRPANPVAIYVSAQTSHEQCKPHARLLPQCLCHQSIRGSGA